MAACSTSVHDDGVHGAELWSTDGTAGGTGMVHDSVPGPDGLAPEHLAVLPGGTALVFSADIPGKGREPALFDPIVGAPGLLKELEPGAVGSLPADFTAYGGKLLFAAATPRRDASCGRPTERRRARPSSRTSSRAPGARVWT